LSYWPIPRGQVTGTRNAVTRMGLQVYSRISVSARAPGSHRRGAPRAPRRIPHSITFVTTPAPTVRPPSRMAKRNPSSIAIGAISATVICTLSPGITISVPLGSSTAPVTSVVRK